MSRGRAVAAILREDAARRRRAGPRPEAVERAVGLTLHQLRADGRRGAGEPWCALLRAQWRLFAPAVRAGTVIVLALGVALTRLPAGSVAGALALGAPALAAVGVSLAFGGPMRASLEVELACVVRPYELLLARLLLAVGLDAAVAAGASLVLLLVGGTETEPLKLVLDWLGPLLLLAGLNLLLTMRWGAAAAAVPSGALWVVSLLATTHTGWAPLLWCAPTAMPDAELACLAGAGCALIAWGVVGGADWATFRGAG